MTSIDPDPERSGQGEGKLAFRHAVPNVRDQYQFWELISNELIIDLGHKVYYLKWFAWRKVNKNAVFLLA